MSPGRGRVRATRPPTLTGSLARCRRLEGPAPAAAPVDAGPLLQQPAAEPAAPQAIDDRRRQRTQPIELMDMRQDALAPRPGPVLVSEVEHLGLELGLVNIAGTLRLARLAHQAE